MKVRAKDLASYVVPEMQDQVAIEIKYDEVEVAYLRSDGQWVCSHHPLDENGCVDFRYGPNNMTEELLPVCEIQSWTPVGEK